VRVLDQWRSS